METGVEETAVEGVKTDEGILGESKPDTGNQEA